MEAASIFKNHMKIKLKIPKQDQLQQLAQDEDHLDEELEEGEIREEEHEDEAETETLADDIHDNHNKNKNQEEVIIISSKRVCPFCNKEFNNGKALGGHMRVHSDHLKATTGGGQSPSPGPSPSRGPSPFQPIRCTLCNKEFRSQKSLFGHMRSHPDRQWRGMQPPSDHHQFSDDTDPPPFTAEETAAVPSSSALDRLSTLMGWKVTGKRGRKAAFSSETSSSSSYDHRATAAAGDLMLLLSGGGGGGEETKSRSPVKKDYYDPDELYYLQNLGVIVKSPEKEEEEEEIIMVDNSVVMASKNKGMTLAVKNNRKRKNSIGKKFRDLVSIDHCGHRSSHNKDKDNNTHPFNPSSSTTEIWRDQNIHSLAPVGKSTGSGLTDIGPSIDHGGGRCEIEVDNEIVIHKCKICNKTFPSGQALGGHQRCHYVPSSDQSSGQGPGPMGRRPGNVFELDLNVVPPMMEEEEEGDVESTLIKSFS